MLDVYCTTKLVAMLVSYCMWENFGGVKRWQIVNVNQLKGKILVDEMSV